MSNDEDDIDKDICDNYIAYLNLKQIFIEILYGNILLCDYYSLQFTKEFICNLPAVHASRWHISEYKYDNVEKIINQYPPNKYYLEVFNDAINYIKTENDNTHINRILYHFINDYGQNFDNAEKIYNSIMEDNEINEYASDIFLLSIEQINEIYFQKTGIFNIKYDYELNVLNVNDYESNVLNNTTIDMDKFNELEEYKYDYSRSELLNIKYKLFYTYSDIYQILIFVLKYIKAIDILSDIASDDDFTYLDDINIKNILLRIKRNDLSILHIIKHCNKILEDYEPFIEEFNELKHIKTLNKLDIINAIIINYNNPKLLINNLFSKK